MMRRLAVAAVLVGISPALAQTLPAPVLNLNNTVVTVPGGIPRTPVARAMDSINVLDYGTMLAGEAALTAACNAATGFTSEIWMPAGVYRFASTVSACSGKPHVAIRGAGSDATLIFATTAATPMQFTQTGISQTVRLQGLGFYSSGTSAAPRAIDISFPAVGAYPEPNVFIDDVAISSILATVASPYPNSYLGGIRLDGAWLAHLNHVVYVGPVPASGLPVNGTSAIELLNCYSIQIDELHAHQVDAAVLQSGYGEGINMAFPQVVNGNYGLNITNAINPAKNNQAGLSYYIHAGELDVVLAGANLPNITNAWIYDNHIALGRAPGGTGVILQATNKAMIQNNMIEQFFANSTATAVAASGVTINSVISGNLFNTATNVVLGSQTASNTVVDNSNHNIVTAPVYSDAGTGNLVSWIAPGVGTITLPKTVATLPTCNTAARGAVSSVSDATAPTYNAALTGGGAVRIPVFCNGTAWLAH